MTLAFLVYLVSVITTIGSLLVCAAGSIFCMFGFLLMSAMFDDDISGHYGPEHPKVVKAQSRKQFLRNKLWIPVALIILAVLVPTKTTIYTMIAAYAGEKIAETPQAQQIGNDAVDVLHELLAKAKHELQDNKSEEKTK